MQLPSLRRLGYRYAPDFRWRDQGVRAILGLMGPSVIAASTTQLNVLANSIFASTLGDGAIFWLAIAFRLMQLPLGLFGVALGTVTLPLLSRLVVAGHMTGFRAELARALRLMFLLTIPSTIGLMILAEPIMSVVYQHGKFLARDAAQAGGALRFYAIGLAGYAALKVLVNAFYALDRRKTPMFVSFFAVALNLSVQLDLHLPAALGPPGAGVLDRVRGDLQFPGVVRPHVPAAGRPGIAAHGRAAGEGAGGRRGARGWCARPRRTGCWPIGRRRPLCRRCSHCSATVILAAAWCSAWSGSLLRIEELDELIVMVRRRLRRGR